MNLILDQLTKLSEDESRNESSVPRDVFRGFPEEILKQIWFAILRACYRARNPPKPENTKKI